MLAEEPALSFVQPATGARKMSCRGARDPYARIDLIERVSPWGWSSEDPASSPSTSRTRTRVERQA